MKNIYLVIIIISLSTYGISAQTEGGTFMLGAGSSLSSVGLSVDDIDPGSLNGVDISSNTTDLNLFGGFFVTDGLVLGLGVTYENTTSKQDGNGYENESSSTTTTIIPSIKYYFGESGFNTGLSYAIGTVKDIDEESDVSGTYEYEDEGSLSMLNLSAGYSFFVNDIIALTPSLVYTTAKVVQEDIYNSNTQFYEDSETELSGLSFGFSIAIHFSN